MLVQFGPAGVGLPCQVPHGMSPAMMQARHQHIGNLVFLLRHYAATRDWTRLAGLVATLMACDVGPATMLPVPHLLPA